MPIEVTQPGASDSHVSEGPLRSGLVPKKITYPLTHSPFLKEQLKSVSRGRSCGVKVRFAIQVNHHYVEVVGGGVFGRFARRGR